MPKPREYTGHTELTGQTEFTGQAVGSGARALLLAQAARMVATLVSNMVLWRVLTREDFGLVAIAMAVVAIASGFGDMGLSLTAIREPNLSRRQWSSLWWLNTGFGLLMTVVVAALAPAIAHLTGESRVTALLLAVSPIFVLNGASVQYRVQLTRDRRFTALALIEAAGLITAIALTIVLALTIHGPWPLIFQQLTIPAVVLVLALVAVRQSPGLPQRGAGIRHMAVGGGALAAEGVLWTAQNAIIPLALGRSQPAETVGVFGNSSNLAHMPHNMLAGPLTRVVIPSLAESWESVAEAGTGNYTPFANKVRAARATYTYSLGIILVLVAAMSLPAVTVVGGAQWLPDGPPLVTLLALALTCHSFIMCLFWALVASGQPGLYLKLQAPVAIAVIVGVILAAPHGATAVAWVFLGGFLLRTATLVFGASDALHLQRAVYLRQCLTSAAVLAVIFVGARVLTWLIPQPGFWLALVTLALGAVWAVAVVAGARLLSRSVRRDVEYLGEIIGSVVGPQIAGAVANLYRRVTRD